jgi:putative acetyltransferase
MPEPVIAVDDPRNPDIQSLLTAHLEFAREHSPPEDVHALDTGGLLADDVTFFSIRREGALLGVGALKEIDPTHGEIKSMHTAVIARGDGVGRSMLDHLLATSRSRGYRRVSLETGTMDAFAPARALYLSAGFEVCEPFAGYWDSPNSVCMTLELIETAAS